MTEPVAPDAPPPEQPSIADQIKVAVDAAEKAVDKLYESAVVPAEHLKDVLAKVEHDVIGQAHVFYDGVKALLDKAVA